MNLLRSICLAAALLSGLWASAMAQAPDPVPAAVAASAPASEHHHAIRHARLRSLQERQTLDPAELKQRCRFESDIASHPPARQVVLSFDDGPEPGQTERILALLDKYRIPASFFMIGAKAHRHPELAALVRAHPRAVVGNHSWDHPNFHDIAPAEQQAELLKSDAEFPATEGAKLFRYPYGNSSCEANEQLHQLQYRIVGWHVDSCDWAFDHNGSVNAHEAASCGVADHNRSDFVGHVLTALQARKGGIVLLHEIHPHTLDQLELLITRILAAGFSFERLDAPAFEASLR